MSYKIKYSLILLSFLVSRTLAQTEISGKITDQKKEPLTGVNILLLNQPDSIFITGTNSSADGVFSMKNIPAGNYILSFSMIGYKKQTFSIQVNNDKPIRINDIILEEDAFLLSTVTVEGKQSPVQFEAGKTIINIASSVLGSQGNMIDALKNLPGVYVKEDGSIILNGQSGANVLINGRSTYLSGENLMSLLKSMPASSVDKIELITSPSAQYDASGKAGLINIKLMKNLYLGISGSLNVNYKCGEYGGREYGNSRFTFQNEKLSFSAVYSHYQGTNGNMLTIFREYQPNNNQSREILLMSQHNRTDYKDANNYFRVNMDYDITKEVIVNCYFSGILNKRNMPGNNYTEFNNATHVTDSVLNTSIESNTNQKTYSGGVFSEYKDNSQREFNISADYMFYRHQEAIAMDSKLHQLVSAQMKNDSLRGDLSGKIGIFSVQGNFSTPIRKHSTMKAGLKSSWIQIGNETDYSNRRYNDNWQVDLSSNNQSKYSENINAAYLQWETKLSRWSFNAGIRLENTRVNGSYFPDDPAEQDLSYSQNYTNIFPNVVLQYNFPNDKNILSLLYNKRITRPNYRDLLPFNQIWDKYTISQGNPDLKAEMTNQFEFAYIYQKIYRTTLFFIDTKGAISQNYRQNEDNVIHVFPDNIGSRSAYGLRFDAWNFLPLKWWQPGINISLFRANSSWMEYGEQKKNGLFSVNLSANQYFQFRKGWGAEISGFYTGRMCIAQTIRLPFGGVSLGIQKKLFKDNASIKVFAEDVFHTQHEDLLIESNILKARTSSVNDTRTIGIAFSYNFKHGEQKRKMARERSIDESKRVNL